MNKDIDKKIVERAVSLRKRDIKRFTDAPIDYKLLMIFLKLQDIEEKVY